MPTALILSSYVASSRVGGFAQALVLAAFGIDPVLVPTVLFGRHPGLGPPGGAAVAEQALDGMLEGVSANGATAGADLVLTGYFASPAQVAAAARVIDAARAAPAPPLVVVDPMMGDAGKGLYVQPAVADAVAAELVGRADIVAPNAWELQRLTGLSLVDAPSAWAAAQALGKPVLVSSVPCADGVGVVYADGSQAWLAAHAASATAPNGVGDLLTVLFAAHRLRGAPVPDALALAVGAVAEAVSAADAAGLRELPVASLRDRLKAPSIPIRLERLQHDRHS